MAFNIGELVGYVKIDHSGARTGMQAAEREVKSGLSRTAQSAEQGGKEVGGRFSKGVTGATASGLKMLGTAVVAGFAVDRVVTFLGDATQAASDLQQTVAKTDAAFGSNSASMQRWAKGAQDALGLSREAALDASSTFGLMFSQLGVAGNESANLSKKLTTLAVDLGQINKLDTAQVVDMMTAAFRGEYDSLQRILPAIDDATIKKRALAESGKSNVDSLTAQDKALATYKLLLEQGSYATGAFADAADTLAVKQAKANAAMQNAKADLGESLLPVMTMLTEVTAGTIKGFVSLVQIVGSIPGPIKAAVTALVAFHLLKGPLSSMLDTVRLKAMYAGDALKNMGKGGGLKSSLTGLVGLINPWTAAITGATFALGAYAEANANAQADVDALTETLDKQTGAFTKGTREFVGKNFAFNVSKEDIDLLERYGVSLSDVTDAALGTDEQFQAMDDRLTELATTSSGAEAAAAGLRSALENMRDKTREARDQQEVYGKAVGDAGQASTDATEPVKEYANETERLKKASSDAAQKQKDLADAMNEVVDAATSADSAAIDYQAALDDATASLKENGKTLDINTEKGRANKQALIDLAASARDSAQANLENGDSVSAVKDQMDTARESFVKVATQMLNGNKKAAEELADEYGLTKDSVDAMRGSMDKVPRQIVSKMKVEKAEAERRLATFKKYLSGNWDKTVTITAVFQAVGSAAAMRVANERKLTSNGINPNLRFGGPVPGYALGGGRIVGAGSDTSDSILGWVAETGRAIRVSRDEFISNASSRRRNQAALEAGNKGAQLTVAGTEPGGGFVQNNTFHMAPSWTPKEVTASLGWEMRRA